jgi:hypothetical protein
MARDAKTATAKRKRNERFLGQTHAYAHDDAWSKNFSEGLESLVRLVVNGVVGDGFVIIAPILVLVGHALAVHFRNSNCA